MSKYHGIVEGCPPRAAVVMAHELLPRGEALLRGEGRSRIDAPRPLSREDSLPRVEVLPMPRGDVRRAPALPAANRVAPFGAAGERMPFARRVAAKGGVVAKGCVPARGGGSLDYRGFWERARNA